MSARGGKMSRSFTITVDRDLWEQFQYKMQENGYGPGEESSAAKLAIRHWITLAPITAELANAKARVYQHCLADMNKRLGAALSELAREYQDAIRLTSPEEAGF
jgi:hypothetical protein